MSLDIETIIWNWFIETKPKLIVCPKCERVILPRKETITWCTCGKRLDGKKSNRNKPKIMPEQELS